MTIDTYLNKAKQGIVAAGLAALLYTGACGTKAYAQENQPKRDGAVAEAQSKPDALEPRIQELVNSGYARAGNWYERVNTPENGTLTVVKAKKDSRGILVFNYNPKSANLEQQIAAVKKLAEKYKGTAEVYAVQTAGESTLEMWRNDPVVLQSYLEATPVTTENGEEYQLTPKGGAKRKYKVFKSESWKKQSREMISEKEKEILARYKKKPEGFYEEQPEPENFLDGIIREGEFSRIYLNTFETFGGKQLSNAAEAENLASAIGRRVEENLVKSNESFVQIYDRESFVEKENGEIVWLKKPSKKNKSQ